MLCYYAHCISLYGKPQEIRDIDILQKLGLTVFNPNCQSCDDLYRKEGMDGFKHLILECDCLAFRALPDGKIPAGVLKELVWAQEGGKPIIELPSCMTVRGMSVEQTREYLRECGQR